MTRSSDVDRLFVDTADTDVIITDYIKWQEYIWAEVKTSLSMDYFDSRDYFVLSMRSLVREEYADIDGEIQKAERGIDPKVYLERMAKARQLPT